MTPTTNASQTAPLDSPRKRWPIILALLALNLLVVGALAVGRLTIILQSGQGLAQAIASTLALMAAGAGIPWCFEAVSRRARPVIPLIRQRWNARINTWTAERRRNKARTRMAQAKGLASAWTQESARITATYTLAYRLAVAKRSHTAR